MVSGFMDESSSDIFVERYCAYRFSVGAKNLFDSVGGIGREEYIAADGAYQRRNVIHDDYLVVVAHGMYNVTFFVFAPAAGYGAFHGWCILLVLCSCSPLQAYDFGNLFQVEIGVAEG